MKMNKLFLSLATAALLAPLSSSIATAGDRNVLILEQNGAGNSIQVDQSNAFDSQIGGAELLETAPLQDSQVNFIDYDTQSTDALSHPLLQIGNDQEANVSLRGNGGAVFLQQGSQGTDSNNDASVTIDSGTAGASTAAILQDGSGNNADISINGSLSEATILQRGDDNQGSIVIGAAGIEQDNTTVQLTQIGNDNEASLQAIGVSDGVYSYTQIGDNLTTATPVVVVTNGASVSITQSQY